MFYILYSHWLKHIAHKEGKFYSKETPTLDLAQEPGQPIWQQTQCLTTGILVLFEKNAKNSIPMT